MDLLIFVIYNSPFLEFYIKVLVNIFIFIVFCIEISVKKLCCLWSDNVWTESALLHMIPFQSRKSKQELSYQETEFALFLAVLKIFVLSMGWDSSHAALKVT